MMRRTGRCRRNRSRTSARTTTIVEIAVIIGDVRALDLRRSLLLGRGPRRPPPRPHVIMGDGEMDAFLKVPSYPCPCCRTASARGARLAGARANCSAGGCRRSSRRRRAAPELLLFSSVDRDAGSNRPGPRPRRSRLLCTTALPSTSSAEERNAAFGLGAPPLAMRTSRPLAPDQSCGLGRGCHRAWRRRLALLRQEFTENASSYGRILDHVAAPAPPAPGARLVFIVGGRGARHRARGRAVAAHACDRVFQAVVRRANGHARPANAK